VKYQKGQSGNRTSGPKSAPIKQIVRDGWTSNQTGVGLERDKRTTLNHTQEVLSYQTLKTLHRQNPLVTKAIDTEPKTALREGWRIDVADKSDDAAAKVIKDKLQLLDFDTKLLKAMILARSVGGAAIYLHFEGEDPSLPIGAPDINKLSAIHVFECAELAPGDTYKLLTDKKFQWPETYKLQSKVGIQPVIHESRLLIFNGIHNDIDQTGACGFKFWGDSVTTTIYEKIRDADIGWTSAATLLTDFAQAVYGVKDLKTQIADGGGLLQQRFEIIDRNRSTTRAICIDKDHESFERSNTPVSGLPDLLDRFMILVSAVTGIPVVIFFEQSPSGLSPSGEADRKNFYQKVASSRSTTVTPQLIQLVQVLALSAGLKNGVAIGYPPLFQETNEERERARKICVEADEIRINTQQASPEDIARSRYSGTTFNFETSIDFDNRAAFKPAALTDEDL
jgi:uncharacterized protein